ncbi:MAG: sigma-E processing peptidase SpoIIGA [Clostridia bacterium]
MEFTFYIDIYFMVNFTINLLLLIITFIYLRRSFKSYRLILASIFGSIIACLFYIINSSLLSAIFSVPLAIIMILISFNYISIGKFIKTLIVFLTSSFILFGITYFLFLLTPLSTIIIYEGNLLYLNVDFWQILLISILMIIVSKTISLVYKFDNTECIYKVEIKNDNKTITINALIDTGNTLCEITSGLPVLVVEKSSIAKILAIDENILDSILQNTNTTKTDENFRYIAYKGVWEENVLMPIFTPTSIHIIKNNKKYLTESVVGITKTTLSTSKEYVALLSPLHFK